MGLDSLRLPFLATSNQHSTSVQFETGTSSSAWLGKMSEHLVSAPTCPLTSYAFVQSTT